MKAVRKIETVDLAIETVYKIETETETVYRLKSASINGMKLPPIELRVPNSGDEKDVRIRSVGGTYVPVRLRQLGMGHAWEIELRGNPSRLKAEKRTVQHRRMRSLAHQMLTIPTT